MHSVFLCPRCGRPAVHWSDHRNTLCGSCTLQAGRANRKV